MTIAVAALSIAFAQSADPSALNELATQHAQAKRLAEAEKTWKQALRVAPEFFPALFNLAFLYYSSAQHAQAEPLLEKSAKLQPGNFNAHYLLGATRVALARRDEALTAWRAAIAIQPKHHKLLQVMAIEYGKGGYFRDAVDVAQRALDLRAEDPEAHFIAIKAYQDGGDFVAAAAIARSAVTKWPESARANFEHGFHLHKAGQPEQATEYLKRAMSADPKYEEPFFFYGDTLINEGRYQDAIEYLQRAIENKPDYVPASVSLARALMESGRLAEAVQHLEKAISIAPKHAQPHLMLSRVYFRMGQEEKARTERDISIRLRRENPALVEAPQARPFPAP